MFSRPDQTLLIPMIYIIWAHTTECVEHRRTITVWKTWNEKKCFQTLKKIFPLCGALRCIYTIICTISSHILHVFSHSSRMHKGETDMIWSKYLECRKPCNNHHWNYYGVSIVVVWLVDIYYIYIFFSASNAIANYAGVIVLYTINNCTHIYHYL